MRARPHRPPTTPVITRRRFLTLTAASGVVLALGPAPALAVPRDNAFSATLSDTLRVPRKHLRKNLGKRHGQN